MLGARAAFSCSGRRTTARPRWARSDRPSSPIDNLGCLDLDGAAPLGIAAAEGYVVVQVGDDVMVSEDAGRTFVAAG